MLPDRFIDMTEKIKSILLVLVAAVLGNSCETDFRITADWKDITVVYGLLDQRDSVQYIKINKAFLGEGNALMFAQVYDSANYPYPLDVRIEEINENGQLVQTIEFDTVTTYKPEEAGTVFPTGAQIVYKGIIQNYYSLRYIIDYPDTVGVEKIWLNDESTYKLYIDFPDTSRLVTSSTGLVKHFEITKPFPGSDDIRFILGASVPSTFSWDRAPNDEGDFKYEIELKFNYEEVVGMGQPDPDTIQKTLILAMGDVYLQPNSAELYFYYSNNNFFTSCMQEIPYKDATEEANIVERHALSVDIIIKAAAADFNLFMKVYQPSTSIVQEKPPYTNIVNGIGVFSARYMIRETKKLSALTLNDLMEMDNNVLKFDEY